MAPLDPKEERVTLRVAIKDLENWQAVADAEGMPLSLWIRRACNAAAKHKPGFVAGTDLDDELVARAIKTYLRGDTRDQPSNASGVEEIGGQPYVVLRNAKGELARYEIVGPAGDGKYTLKLAKQPTKKGRR